jgi:NAD(P)H-dependent FMN reductase
MVMGAEPAATLTTLVFYGSYRRDRAGIRLARYVVDALNTRGHAAELIDAREVGLPMLDRMYKEYPPGEAPAAMAQMAVKICRADAFVFIAGEYNWGMQPGLKNLTDHYLEEWFWRPAAIVSYSNGRIAGARSNFVWHGTLSEMGTVVISSTVMVGPVTHALDAEGHPIGEGGDALVRSFPPFAADLEWWAHAAKRQRAVQPTPY